MNCDVQWKRRLPVFCGSALHRVCAVDSNTSSGATSRVATRPRTPAEFMVTSRGGSVGRAPQSLANHSYKPSVELRGASVCPARAKNEAVQ